MGVRGVLNPRARESFDAQVAKVTDLQSLRKTLNGIGFHGFAQRPSQIPNSFLILAPGNTSRIIRAAKVRFHPNFVIRYPGIGPIRHKLLVESRAASLPGTISGDSGSPVLARHPDGGFVLTGMHIAGRSGKALMIPAWELMNHRNYGLRGEEKWRLWPTA